MALRFPGIFLVKRCLGVHFMSIAASEGLKTHFSNSIWISCPFSEQVICLTLEAKQAFTAELQTVSYRNSL
jgi:hypothetical protein